MNIFARLGEMLARLLYNRPDPTTGEPVTQNALQFVAEQLERPGLVGNTLAENVAGINGQTQNIEEAVSAIRVALTDPESSAADAWTEARVLVVLQRLLNMDGNIAIIANRVAFDLQQELEAIRAALLIVAEAQGVTNQTLTSTLVVNTARGFGAAQLLDRLVECQELSGGCDGEPPDPTPAACTPIAQTVDYTQFPLIGMELQTAGGAGGETISIIDAPGEPYSLWLLLLSGSAITSVVTVRPSQTPSSVTAFGQVAPPLYQAVFDGNGSTPATPRLRCGLPVDSGNSDAVLFGILNLVSIESLAPQSSADYVDFVRLFVENEAVAPYRLTNSDTAFWPFLNGEPGNGCAALSQGAPVVCQEQAMFLAVRQSYIDAFLDGDSINLWRCFTLELPDM